jgi:hypothetical protein
MTPGSGLRYMTSWIKQRDELLAQTLAFVRQVEAEAPAKTARSATGLPATPQPPRLPATAKPPATTAASVTAVAPVTSPAVAKPVDAPRPRAAPADPAPPDAAVQTVVADHPAKARIAPHVLSERDDIQRRVAAFRARQQEMTQEREDYYESVQAKIRNVLGNGSGSDQL